MKIGVSAFAWTTRFESRHFHLLSSLREQGITGFEIAMFDPAALDTRAIRSEMEKQGLDCTVCAILPPGINPISSDATVRTKSRDHLARCIETGAELGAKLLGGPLYAPIGYLPGRRRQPDEWNWAVECFQQIGDVLDAHNMTLAVEPVNRAETFFLRTTAEAKAFCDAVDHPRLGITLDTFHANIEEKSIVAAAFAAGSRLRHIHVSENDRGVPGSGHVDFFELIAALGASGYDGYLMIEGFGYTPDEPDSVGAVWGQPGVAPENIAFDGAAYLRELARCSRGAEQDQNRSDK